MKFPWGVGRIGNERCPRHRRKASSEEKSALNARRGGSGDIGIRIYSQAEKNRPRMKDEDNSEPVQTPFVEAPLATDIWTYFNAVHPAQTDTGCGDNLTGRHPKFLLPPSCHGREG